MDIPIKVVGVSDKPNSRTVHVIATEDEDYNIGQVRRR
jgi:hypothetical protein